jgi:NADH-quinone oxidoreductase subunit D
VSHREPIGSVREMATGVTVDSAAEAGLLPPDVVEGREESVLTVNFGPHHPATHGVLRLLVELEGEVVHDVKPYVELRGQVVLEGDPAH